MEETRDRERISRRKNQHLETVLSSRVEPHPAGAGWDEYSLVHCALPEIGLPLVSTKTDFLGYPLSMPLMISATTGGTRETHKILETLAAAAEHSGVAIGVGSQRIALEHEDLSDMFCIRRLARSVPVLANLGAVQLNYGLGISECQRAIEMVEADALVLHLNPLQECLQAGGNTDFSGLLSKIGEVCRRVDVPVIAKEVGFGISPEVALRLLQVGVSWIDIAGTGGTSWSAVEAQNAGEWSRDIASSLRSWGTPTAHLLEQYGRNFAAPVIASGGVRNGVHIAKALALGASMAGIALPLVRDATDGAEKVVERLSRLQRELQIAMFCTGCRDITSLRTASITRLRRG